MPSNIVRSIAINKNGITCGNNDKYVVVYDKSNGSYTHCTDSDLNSPNMSTFGGQLLMCEVSPFTTNDKIKVFVGGQYPWCLKYPDNNSAFKVAGGIHDGLHNDMRSAYFTDDGQNEILFLGTDGGLTKIINPTSSNTGWEYIANDGTDGIHNLDIQGFDCSGSTEDITVIGTSHDGGVIRKDGEWYRIFSGGDYQTALIDPTNPNHIYVSRYATPNLEYTNNMNYPWDD